LTVRRVSSQPEQALLRQALALALGAAISLGLARFSYALLLGPMRDDLGWRYVTAGAMNTANAAGYLLGALAVPHWIARRGPRSALVGGGLATAVLLALHGLVHAEALLGLLRLLAGAASAATFVSGGLLAARLGSRAVGAMSASLVLGLYYGGTGLGIIVSALLVPAFTGSGEAFGWQPAWQALGAVALLMTLLMAWGTAADAPLVASIRAAVPLRWQRFGFALAGYFLFGLGYIGYMTFIVTLLREQQLGSAAITAFYITLGLGVMASSWLWAGLLQRLQGGQPMALLNALLAIATLLPVLSTRPAAVFVSGALFGSVFLSVVAASTAVVRHNLAAASWSRGIAVFTAVFALGQIAGPSLVGLIADGPGGLARGLAVSAVVLALGAVLALGQRPLASQRQPGGG